MAHPEGLTLSEVLRQRKEWRQLYVSKNSSYENMLHFAILIRLY